METSIIVLNWNSYSKTARCLAALERVINPTRVEVVLVDNGSTDGSGERLHTEFPAVRYLPNSENLGFSAGVNVGLRDAFERGSETFLLLNSDMIVDKGFLDRAYAILCSDQSVGAVTGKILHYSPSGTIWHAGGHVDNFRVAAITRGHHERDVGQYDTECDTEWASGAMSLYPRRTIDRIGFLPEEYFFGQEEWDYSTLIIRSRFRIRYSPAFLGVHEQGSSYKGGHPTLNVYGGTRNRFIYAKRHLPKWRVWLFTAYYGLYLLLLWPLRAKSGCATRRDFIVRYRAAWLAYWDQFQSNEVKLMSLARAQRRIGESESYKASWK